MVGRLPAAAGLLAHPLTVILIAGKRGPAILTLVAVNGALMGELVVAPGVFFAVVVWEFAPQATL